MGGFIGCYGSEVLCATHIAICCRYGRCRSLLQQLYSPVRLKRQWDRASQCHCGRAGPFDQHKARTCVARRHHGVLQYPARSLGVRRPDRPSGASRSPRTCGPPELQDPLVPLSHRSNGSHWSRGPTGPTGLPEQQAQQELVVPPDQRGPPEQRDPLDPLDPGPTDPRDPRDPPDPLVLPEQQVQQEPLVPPDQRGPPERQEQQARQECLVLLVLPVRRSCRSRRSHWPDRGHWSFRTDRRYRRDRCNRSNGCDRSYWSCWSRRS